MLKSWCLEPLLSHFLATRLGLDLEMSRPAGWLVQDGLTTGFTKARPGNAQKVGVGAQVQLPHRLAGHVDDTR